MSIVVIGMNHKTAPISLREKAYFALDKLPLYLQDMLQQPVAQEAVLLSTCNRSELYCETNDVDKAIDWFCKQTSAERLQLESALYVYQEEVAVTHMMQVACGLDSMVLGEPQILGQMKEAFSESYAVGAVGTLFHRLFQHIFTLAKEIRTSTAIGACPVSVASAATHFAKQQVANFSQAQIVLFGAGDTTALLLRYLKSQLTKPIKLVNRSLENAQALAEMVGGAAFGLEQAIAVLTEADVVFSSTSSAVPLINKAMLSEVMRARQQKPLILIDLAVPRDIDPAVTELPGVQLYCIDDLKAIIETNRQGREHAAEKAREMIAQQCQTFMTQSASHDKVAQTIRTYRGQIEEICQAELLKARQQLKQGIDPQQVLQSFAYAFTNKLLHAPSVQLRQAGEEGRFELLRFAKQLFGLPDPDLEVERT